MQNDGILMSEGGGRQVSSRPRGVCEVPYFAMGLRLFACAGIQLF